MCKNRGLLAVDLILRFSFKKQILYLLKIILANTYKQKQIKTNLEPTGNYYSHTLLVEGIFMLLFLVNRGGRVVRWCWVNFQCRGVLLLWIRVGQRPTALAVGRVGVVWVFFSQLSFLYFFLPLSLGDGPI